MKIYGVDFTCAPRRAKPITVAAGCLTRGRLSLEKLEALQTFAEFEAFLMRPGPWIGGFDYPFSLPRVLVRELGWPRAWPRLVAHCASMDRLQFRAAIDAYRAKRPIGSKYAHRATDRPAGSSSPMKLVNPPVALMFHEGARRLLATGVHLPALHEGDPHRVALEAYPGLLVRRQLGLRRSYKSDTRAEQTLGRRNVRAEVLRHLKQGRPLGVRLECDRRLEKTLLDDGSGDALDAAICAVQAAWAAARPRYGLPVRVPSGEGWIVTA